MIRPLYRAFHKAARLGHPAEAPERDNGKMTMSPGDIARERERLHDALINLSYDEDGWILSPGMVPLETRQVALDLATCIAGTENDQYYVSDWMSIYEALGDIEKAQKIGERDLQRRIVEIRTGEYDEYPKLLVEFVDMIQWSADFQAKRLWMLNRREDSLQCLKEVIELANMHNVPLDDDLLDLRDELLERLSASDGEARTWR